jgi:hypothetical protein
MKNSVKTYAAHLLISFLALLFLPDVAFAQQKETRKERKAKEKQEQLAGFETAKQLLQDTTFLIPAETFQLSDGSNFTSVDGTINFLKIDKSDGVLQLGNALSPNPGRNNLGGITVTGKVSNIRIKDNEKRNSLFMTFNLIGPVITARVAITLTGSDKAALTIDGIYTGKGINLRGPVKAPGDKRIFQGAEF